MQKRWSILLIIALLIGSMVIVGCGKSADQASKTSNPAGSTEVSTSSTDASSKGDKELTELLDKAKANKDGISYDMVMNGSGMSVTTKVWQQGGKMRTESSFGGMQVVMIQNPDKDIYCTYMPSTKTATALDEKTKANLKSQAADQWSADSKAEYKIIGSEKKDGFDCKIVEVKAAGVDTAKVWLREDIGYPVAFETKANGQVVNIAFKNYKLGKIADTQFELPAGVTVTQMPAQP